MHLGKCTEEREHLLERVRALKITGVRRKPRLELTRELRQELR